MQDNHHSALIGWNGHSMAVKGTLPRGQHQTLQLGPAQNCEGWWVGVVVVGWRGPREWPEPMNLT